MCICRFVEMCLFHSWQLSCMDCDCLYHVCIGPDGETHITTTCLTSSYLDTLPSFITSHHNQRILAHPHWSPGRLGALSLVQHMVHHGGGFLIIYLQVHQVSVPWKKSVLWSVSWWESVSGSEYLIHSRTETKMLHRLLYLFWILALVSASADDGPGDAEFK